MTEQTAHTPPLLELRGLTHTYGRPSSTNTPVLNDLAFSVNASEVVALVGESGSGKSTVARVIARLLRPDRGALLWQGEDMLTGERRGASLGYRRLVQMIFQDPFGSLNPVHTVAHHLERPLLRHQRADAAGLRPRILELLSVVGLTPPEAVADAHPHELSGGQRQRVAIARALAVEPRLILADEPTSMLDVSIRMGVLNLLRDLVRDRGVSILFITHDLASARYLADRIIVLRHGRIAEQAPTETLLSNPRHEYTQRLLGAAPRRMDDLTQGDITTISQGHAS